MNVLALVSRLLLLAFFTSLGIWWITRSESVSDDFFGALKPRGVRAFWGVHAGSAGACV